MRARKIINSWWFTLTNRQDLLIEKSKVGTVAEWLAAALRVATSRGQLFVYVSSNVCKRTHDAEVTPM